MPQSFPDRDTWRRLMRSALRVIDSLRENGYGELDFRFGGGTVLMLRFDHRLSKDIDLFIDDAQALGYISPRLNAVAERDAQSYEEQANSVKLVLPDGDIDVIVAGTVIRDAFESGAQTLDFEGRKLRLEPTSEILAKKMLYRAATFKARDVFDMAAVLTLDRPAALRAIAATRSVRPTLLRRLSAIARLGQDELTKDIVLTPAGVPLAETMVATLMQALGDAGKQT